MTKEYSRAFDTSYEAHVGLIHKFARKGFGRLQQAKICIDYEDVFQEMSIAYMKALEKYDPEKGISFSAYLGRTIWNNFNKFAESEIEAGLRLQVVPFQADNDGKCLLDVTDSGIESPEYRAETKQEMKINSSLLGPVSSFILKQLIEPSEDMLRYVAEKRGDEPNSNNPRDNALARAANHITVKGIVSYYKIKPEKARIARRQLERIYGVRV